MAWGQESLTDDKDDFDKDVQVNGSDGLFVLCVPESRAEGNDDRDVKGGDEDEPIERCFEGSVM